MSLTPIYDDLLREFEGIIESILSGDTAAEAAEPEQAEQAAN
ncbi:hypothetical protein AB0A74_19055 [Saccharothrix sp. NPDC042600]|nr:hypothetical protein GCM10017745_75780 [Saccharothrix mutabilis subsp. capreolus]